MMYLGVDYYPEQWEPQQLETDLDTIVELGCNVIRIGEFAWHMMEPSPGQYDFNYFDHVIKRAKKRGLKIIFGTPTATVPAWLVQTHPQILSVFENGTPRAYGGRHTSCYANPEYRRACREIVTALATHYADEDAIVAWQTDNELGHEGSDECWCENCRNGFQEFLRNRFDGNIETLNATYGTRFWSQEYDSFEQIPVPSATITTHNPALRLDWERFRSELIVQFHAEQVKILRHIIKASTIIHDFPGGGVNKHVDYAAIAGDLDVVAYNNYPVWGGQIEPLPPHEIAFGLDYMRGLKRRNFWITEAIMGAQGHDVTGFLPRPKQAQMWSYQAMARGCESLMYFRYRGATKGAEQFCYGIIDADNRRGAKYAEVEEFFATIKPYEDVLTAPLPARVAILYDYDSLASMRIQRQSHLMDVPGEMKRWHRCFYERNVMVDVVPGSDPQLKLSGYDVIVAAHLTVTKRNLLEKLKTAAQRGTQVILTFRTAVKDTHNNLVFGQSLPLHLTDFVGAVVAQTESVPYPDSLELVAGEGTESNRNGSALPARGSGGVFRDMLQAADAQVLYRYNDQFYNQYAAVTRRKQGSGAAYYVGTSLDDHLRGALVEQILKNAGIPTRPGAENLEVVRRATPQREVEFVINHSAEVNHYGNWEIGPYGCLIRQVKNK